MIALDHLDARRLLDAIDTEWLLGLRDRALIGLMSATACSARAAVRLRLGDMEGRHGHAWIRLEDNQGQMRRARCNGTVSDWLRDYVRQAEIDSAGAFLFRAAGDGAQRLLVRSMSQQEIYDMVCLHAAAAGIRARLGFSDFRKAGLAVYFQQADWLLPQERSARPRAGRQAPDHAGDALAARAPGARPGRGPMVGAFS